MLRTLGAVPRHRLRGRRPKRAEEGAAEPDPVPVTLATAIAAAGFEGKDEAESWLEGCRRDEDTREAVVERSLLVLNRAVHAHRLAAGDPYTNEVARHHAHTVRVGYGSGEQVADCRWTAAYSLPAPRGRSRRAEMLGSGEEVARIIGGRNPVLPSEDMALRARLDLDQQRPVQAALQLEAALAALAGEQEDGDGSEQVTELLTRRSKVNALGEDELAKTLLELERVLRRRRHRW